MTRLILSLMVAAISCTAQAGNKMAQQDYIHYTGVLWQNGEEPNVVPVEFRTESDCKNTLNQLNNATEQTIHVKRNVLCSPIHQDMSQK